MAGCHRQTKGRDAVERNRTEKAPPGQPWYSLSLWRSLQDNLAIVSGSSSQRSVEKATVIAIMQVSFLNLPQP